jgi:predicted ATPase
MLKDHVAHEPHVRWECRSTEYSQNSALFPLVDLFQRLLRFQAEETAEEKLDKLAQALRQYRLPVEASVPLFAPLLSLPILEDHYPPLNLSPQRQRQKTLEALVAVLLEQTKQQPVLFIVEDLHWTDPSTLELLNLVIDQTPTASLLVLLTCRPHFQPAWHHRSSLTEITVHRLSHAQGDQFVTGMTEGKTFPTAVLQQILDKTDGVPLFVEEITKAILVSGQLKDVDGHYELAESFRALTIPATLQDSLMARLDRLVTAKAIAQYAAVIGRQFSYDVLSTVSQLDAATLQRELGRLVEAEIVYQQGVPPQATYTFKHALIRDAAYESLLRRTRQEYHQRIAQVLAEHFPETAEAEPELLAHHYTEAGMHAQAVSYWQRAGQRASAGSAYVEAISHFTKGLAVLQGLPDTPERAQRELDLQIALGQAFTATKGQAAPEVGHTYRRARELCQQGGETPQRFRVLWGLWYFHVVRAELQTARELGEELLTLAQHLQDPMSLLGAHFALGGALLCLGEFPLSRQQWDQHLALYNPLQHPAHVVLFGWDLGVFGRSWASHALWALGYPDQALAMSREALTLAQELSHPFSRAVALDYAAMLHQFRREPHAVHERAEAAIALCTEQGFAYYLAWGTTMQGWALVAQGQGEADMAQLRRGLAALRATGAALRLPYYLALLAEACGQTDRAAEGLALLAEALAHAHHIGESWTETELHRLKGELLLQAGVQGLESGVLTLDTGLQTRDAEAEACFQQALAIARRQQAKSWELRAAMSLARLWQQRGKRAEAYALLAPIYGWFTEGFDTADLQEAKVLLEELAG